MSMDGSTAVKQRWVLRTFLVHAFASTLAFAPIAIIAEGRWETERALGFAMVVGGIIGGIVSFIYGRRRGGGTVGVAIISAVYPVMGLFLIVGGAA